MSALGAIADGYRAHLEGRAAGLLFRRREVLRAASFGYKAASPELRGVWRAELAANKAERAAVLALLSV